LILGVLLILLIFFLPEGVMGFFVRKFGKCGGEEDALGRGEHAEG